MASRTGWRIQAGSSVINCSLLSFAVWCKRKVKQHSSFKLCRQFQRSRLVYQRLRQWYQSVIHTRALIRCPHIQDDAINVPKSPGRHRPCCWLYLPFNAKQSSPWSYNPPARSLIHQSNGGFPPPSLEMIWPHENKMNAGSAGYAVPLTSLYFSLNSGLFV